MARYKELLAEKQQLEKLIEEARQREAAVELDKIRKTVAEFGFTPEDIFGKRRKDAGRPVAPKYRNPETGETWIGRGRAPRWLNYKDLERFLIND